MSRIITNPKLVGTTENVVFDFLSLLAVGETISTQSVAASVYSGTDASPSAVVSGAATASGSQVTQGLTGGVSGVIYKLVATITTSLSKTLQLSTFMAVVPDL